VLPYSDPHTLPDSTKVAIGLAVTPALWDANALAMLTIMTVCKNMMGNLLLTPSAQTLAANITAYLPAITEATQKVQPSLLPVCLNEKWHKLAVYAITTDYFWDMEEGMAKLQHEIENNHSIS
jgi:hypothetical protein